MSNESILSIASQFGWVVAIILAILLYLVANPSIALKLIKFTARMLYFLRLSDNRTRVGRELESTVNSISLRLQREMPTLFSKSVRIAWLRDGKQFANIEDGQIILYVEDNPNESELLTDTTMLYIKRGVNLESRPFIDRPLIESIDIALAQRILRDAPVAYELLQEKYVNPGISHDRQRQLFELACTLDDYGVLTRIVMSEFSSLGLRQSGMTPTALGRAETVHFAEFVKRVVTRQNDVVPLRFSGKVFNSTVALIARPEVRESSGMRHYQRMFRNDIDTGVRIIHLLGRGNLNELMARQLALWARKSELVTDVVPRDFVESTPDGSRIRAICITCFSAKVTSAHDLNAIDDMYNALYEVVPETVTGDILIYKVARQPNVRTKVLVHSSSRINTIQKLVGDNEENIERIRLYLGTDDEIIDFILWESDVERLLVKALYPLRESEIFRILVDRDSASAQVALYQGDEIGATIGRDGVIVRLAEQITGYQIAIVDKEALLSPEEHAVEALSRGVAPIGRGDITIKGLVRHPEMIKAFVCSDRIDKPEEFCKANTDYRKVRKVLSGEFISFAAWHESVEKRIGNSLIPLNPTEIVSCTIDESRMTATVFVLTVQAARQASGQGGKNVKAASELTGYKIRVKVAD